jgi:hypothetical protein
MIRKLLDDDGENRAVRTFLQLYGATSSITLGDMCGHLSRSGFDGCWPEWVCDTNDRTHLTKGGAQDWLRHLFALEASTSPAQEPQLRKVLFDLAETTGELLAFIGDEEERILSDHHVIAASNMLHRAKRLLATPPAAQEKDAQDAVCSYDISPPQEFIDYVAKNYNGDVFFHDPEWHALRLWNAAMKNATPAVINAALRGEGDGK